jgi:hypothetical protein
MSSQIKFEDMKIVKVKEQAGEVTVVARLEEGRHGTITVMQEYVKVTYDRKKEANGSTH